MDRRVLTAPHLGAFAMITSTRSLRDERFTVSLADFINLCRGPRLTLVSWRCGVGDNSASDGQQILRELADPIQRPR